MSETIKIHKGLVFGYDDLMSNVDPNHSFTLKEVFDIVMDSTMPKEVLSKIIQCEYVYDYIMESFTTPISSCADIEYLRLKYVADVSNWDNCLDSGGYWSFDGIGYAGVIPDDLRDNITEEQCKEMQREGWRQSYAIEFTPVNELRHLPIKIDFGVTIEDYRGEKLEYQEAFMRPSISLITLLYAIFWELSFCGAPDDRDEKKKEINQSIEDIKSGKSKFIPLEEVKKNIEEKLDQKL